LPIIEAGGNRRCTTGSVHRLSESTPQESAVAFLGKPPLASLAR
jgi:hypothetical protein